jgi:hypothetical protein
VEHFARLINGLLLVNLLIVKSQLIKTLKARWALGSSVFVVYNRRMKKAHWLKNLTFVILSVLTLFFYALIMGRAGEKIARIVKHDRHERKLIALESRKVEQEESRVMPLKIPSIPLK